MQVNTRGGVFSPSGYGGGVFNQNVAFGAIESLTSPVFVGGLGAWGAVPWYCWGGGDPDLPVNQAFRDCAGTVQSRPEYRGKPLSDPSLIGAIEQACGQHCNMKKAAETVYGSGQYSAQTANLQSRINTHVYASRANDPAYQYCPVAVDGKMGPETCTAVRTLFPGNVPPQCSNFGTSDWINQDCSGGKDVPPIPKDTDGGAGPPSGPPSVPPKFTPPKKKGVKLSSSAIIGGIVAVAAVTAAVWYGSEQGWFSKEGAGAGSF